MSATLDPGAKALGMPWLLYRLAWRRRVEKFATDAVNAGDVVFLGDSITYGAKWEELFPGLPVRNRGISGDTSSGVLARLDEISRGRPAKVFVLIGTNDVHFRRSSTERIVPNVAAIVDAIRRDSPMTQVSVQSIMPRRPKRTEVLRALNAELEAAAVAHGATWIDLWPVFDDGTGCMRREYSRDRLHPNAAGNRAWAEHLRPRVES